MTPQQIETKFTLALFKIKTRISLFSLILTRQLRNKKFNYKKAIAIKNKKRQSRPHLNSYPVRLPLFSQLDTTTFSLALYVFYRTLYVIKHTASTAWRSLKCI